MSTLTPDLWAAHAAARRLQDDAQRAAAWNLLPQGIRLPSGRMYWINPDPSRAGERAEVARAANYEARHLADAAREAASA